jgi:hypothetical protein
VAVGGQAVLVETCDGLATIDGDELIIHVVVTGHCRHRQAKPA